MNGDEQLLRGRIYGHDHDDPNPGPLPHRTYATPIGGPLDGAAPVLCTRARTSGVRTD
ncbi:hypothetical protein ACFRLW_29695 [Streptomyces sp. NPDC056728]